MNINTEIKNSKDNIAVLRRLLNNERYKLRQMKFNRKMKDRRRR